MGRPMCSVVIPTHNCLTYLKFALNSVRLQEMDDLEILIVDDGSSDGTWDWLSGVAREDARVRPLRLEGEGPASARNHALAQARAPFAAFLDADDLWWPQKLARQLAYHRQNPDTAFSFTDYLHVDVHGGVRGTCFDFWRPDFADRAGPAYKVVQNAELALLGCNATGTSTVVASVKALQNANGFAKCASAEDWLLWLTLARGGAVACSSAVTMSYLMRPGSETRNVEARLSAMKSIVEPYGRLEQADARRAVRQARARISVAEAEMARGRGRYWRAAGFHLAAALATPSVRTVRACVADAAAGLRQRAPAQVS